MRFLILCSWASPSNTVNKYGDNIVVNDYQATDFDYVVDWDQYHQHSAKFPAKKRAIAFGEPSAYVDLSPNNIARMKDYYQGGILSWHGALQGLPQTKKFRFGTSWVPRGSPEDKKTFGISGVMRVKGHHLPGYKLRQKVIDNQWNITTPGIVYNSTGVWKNDRFKYPLDNKEPSYGSMFNFAIENCQEHGYFTEKLMDCLQQYQVPLYWGDPNIDNFFEPHGLIKLDENNFVQQINSLTEHDYNSRKEAIRENAERAQNFLDIFSNAGLSLTDRWNLSFVRNW